MRRWIPGVVIALGVAISAFAISYAVLNHFYGTTSRDVYAQVGNESLGQVVPKRLDEVEQSNPIVLTYISADNAGAAGGYENLTFQWSQTNWQSAVQADNWENVKGSNRRVLNSISPAMVSIQATTCDQLSGSEYILTAPAPPVITSVTFGVSEGTENAAGASFFVYETKPVNTLPISASVGILMSLVVFGVWVGYRRMWGDATSTLLEHGLHDMTVRDVEIVGQIMDLKEFTIPQLIKETRASKTTVWRTVQKLVGQGLVQETDQTKLAANGMGGRGKPSRIYKYVGKPETE